MLLSKLVLLESNFCTQKKIQEALKVRENNQLQKATQTAVESNSTMLKAKAIDEFNFVDYPWIQVDAMGERIWDKGCNCPEFRERGTTCKHLAALALEFGAFESQAKKDAAASPAMSVPVEVDMPQEEPQKEINEEPVQLRTPVQVMEKDILRDDPQDEPQENSGFYNIDSFSYKFCNSRTHLYPDTDKPRIPLERFLQVFGNTMFARSMYEHDGLWGGSCFGFMSSSSMMAMEDSGLDPSEFKSEYYTPHQIQLTDKSEKVGMTLHEMIEAMQIMQYSHIIGRPRHQSLRSYDCMERLCERVRAFQEGRGLPVGMAMWDSHGGHSVLPFYIESGDTEDKMHIYDPNWPRTTRYAYFKKDAYGQYEAWRFPNRYDEYNSEEDGELAMDAYEYFKEVWDNRGNSDKLCMLQVMPGTIIKNKEGTKLASVYGTGVSTYDNNICGMPLTGRLEQKGPFLVSAPEAIYMVRNESGDQAGLSVRCTGVNYDIMIETEAKEALVLVNEAAQEAWAMVSEPNKEFSITVNATENGELRSAKLKGITGINGINFAQCKGELLGKGYKEGIQLFINDELTEDCVDWADAEENETPILLTPTDKKNDET